jgi:hypothetical protein
MSTSSFKVGDKVLDKYFDNRPGEVIDHDPKWKNIIVLWDNGEKSFFHHNTTLITKQEQ